MPKKKEDEVKDAQAASDPKSQADADNAAASARVQTGGQDPNVPIPPSARDSEPETITAEELASSVQPKAPEKPLEAKDVGNDPVPGAFDSTEPAPAGAPAPAEPTTPDAPAQS